MMGDRIAAAVALSVRWVAEKDAGDGAGCKLMRRSGGDARVEGTAEDAKLIIRRLCTEEKVMRCKVSASATWTNVNEEGSSGESVRPKARRHIGVKEESPNAVVKSAKDTLNAIVLLRSVRAGETKSRAMCGEKSANSDVVELLPVICLQRENGMTKLHENIGVESGESGYNIRLATQRKGPHIMRKIIKYDKIIKIARITCNRRDPDITMN